MDPSRSLGGQSALARCCTHNSGGRAQRRCDQVLFVKLEALSLLTSHRRSFLYLQMHLHRQYDSPRNDHRTKEGGRWPILKHNFNPNGPISSRNRTTSLCSSSRLPQCTALHHIFATANGMSRRSGVVFLQSYRTVLLHCRGRLICSAM